MRVSRLPKDLRLGRTVLLGMDAYEFYKSIQLTDVAAMYLSPSERIVTQVAHQISGVTEYDFLLVYALLS